MAKTLEEKLIKSPLNYTGNKFRILDQISRTFPKKINNMIDMFCGGATVGLNTCANKVIFIDSNKRIVDLLKFLSKQNFSEFLLDCEELIKNYNLSYSYKYGYEFYRKKCHNQTDNNGLKEYNSSGFYKLRDDYNNLKNKTSKKANLMLYILMVYAFNNDIRFNSNGDFNLPIGKTDLNKMNVQKIFEYINRTKDKKIEFKNMDFCNPNIYTLLNNVDFVYMDPPYLIGNAVYNTTWNNEKEYKLLEFLDYLLSHKINFALSNVISKVGATNEPLSYWCYKNKDKINVTHINYHYRSASYNKTNRNAKEQEVVVSNKEY